MKGLIRVVEDNDYTDDHRPRGWRALDDIQKENIVFREKIRVIEDAFSRHLDFHDEMSKTLETIRAKLETNGTVLVEMKADMKNEKTRVDGLWQLPVKILTVLGIGSSATIGWYQIWKWVQHATDVKIQK